MLRSGELRQRLAQTLSAAYGDGLLSESTLVHRLDLLFGSRLIDPARLTGDLSFRAPRPSLATRLARFREGIERYLSPETRSHPAQLLALDWSGGTNELLIGRDAGCDVVLAHATVSRRHIGLHFRDGHWILRDLGSTNGTLVNGTPVRRCQLQPGDRLTLGDERMIVD
jgi:hypothetical protein